MNFRNLIQFFRHVRIRTIKKGTIIVDVGDTKKELFFIRKGLIRSYLITDEEEEITFQLFPESHICGNVTAILFDEPSRFRFQALERSKVYAIDYDAFHHFAAQNPEFSALNIRHLSKSVMKQAFQRVESFVFLSPEERYKKYVKDYPDVVNRAPDKYIAHVLGITPVSLSRIRSRIASRKS